MQALTRFGICEEKFFKYDSKFMDEPTWFHSSLADDFRAETYMRVDKKGMTRVDLLTKLKQLISRNYPIQFGFTVFENTIDNATGEISSPGSDHKTSGGHAVVITGFDDRKEIKDKKSGVTTVGAFKIRNSWGTGWGELGYGWLPYEYITHWNARDFWMIFRLDWIKLENTLTSFKT